MAQKRFLIIGSLFALLFFCFAMASLVETPDGPLLDRFQSKPLKAASLPANDTALTHAAPLRPLSVDAAMATVSQSRCNTYVSSIDCDRNGIPLIHSDYRRAAYVKFPPEGTLG